MREGEDAKQKRKGLEMDRDTMTPEEILEARLASIERRIEQLEIWTGADEDGDPEKTKVSVVESVLAQEKIVRHMLRLLDFNGTEFSIAQFRNTLRMVDDAKADPLSKDWDPEFTEGLKGVIARLIPDPVPRERPRQNQLEAVRPFLPWRPREAHLDGL
ncbi:hypothetical protein [Shinella sp. JR1-6]|uniref:hypothetical protein n=1 Tax=Shinella sp. JR1-6 TaxID=2527671 RepID=UPI00102D3EFE|nr:hypothetical protein [Shinella sp. JR1-6]